MNQEAEVHKLYIANLRLHSHFVPHKTVLVTLPTSLIFLPIVLHILVAFDKIKYASEN